MKFLSLPITKENATFFIEPFTGSLLLKETAAKEPVRKYQPPKVLSAIRRCDFPYLLRAEILNVPPTSTSEYVKYYAKGLNWACKNAFWLARAITAGGRPVYDSTTQAIYAYRKLYAGAEQQDMCLSRTLFAASTSKTFKSAGVIFIGVFLPARNMHAWIIEGDTQPDPWDTIWTNYQPVAVLY